MADWRQNQDDTHSAKLGAYTLKVWQSEQYASFGWTVTKGHIIRAGDAKTLEQAQTEAEAAAKIVSKS